MCKSWKVMLAVLPCLLAPLGCVPNEAVRYNNDVAGITRELEATGKEFGEKLRSSQGNAAKAKQLYDEAAKTTGAIIKRGKALTPPNTPEGKALHKALQSYLESQDQMIRVDFATIARYVGQNKMSAIPPIINAAQQQEQAQVQQLKSAQQSFAKANNIHLLN
jgi:hypothetical protein